MRILHTSDWHIGRIFYERSLIEDQMHVLNQIIDIVQREKIEAVLIAGDVYDRAVPPTEGIELLDHVLSEIALKLRVPVLVISGNHDSGERLAFGAKLLDQQRLKIVGSLGSMLAPLVLEDKHGKVEVYGIPYADPVEARIEAGEDRIGKHQDAMDWCVRRIGEVMKNPAIAVAHAYVVGGQGSDSERPLSIGGHPYVDAGSFNSFVYTALGHLHQRQSPLANVHYSGSLLSYHFSERDVPKSVTIVDLGADRVPKLETVALEPKRKLKVFSGEYDDLLANAKKQPNPVDYILVRRFYDRPRPEALTQLRTYYPNLLGIETMTRNEAGATVESGARARVSKEKNIYDIFSGFYTEMTNQPLHQIQEECVRRHVSAGSESKAETRAETGLGKGQ